ncbi:alginate O-acetyltransferase AlgX-related protein [Haliea sp. E17]|uniref:alginate O-acetyltransferase AlgX-related protein n=1 Tax=Haliea sp. E17 TaxID=3401576 RepID=UPI003AAC2004
MAIVIGLLATYAAWNLQQWTEEQARRFARGGTAERLHLLFENGHISERVALALYRSGISVQPRFALVGREGWLYLGDKFEGVASAAAGGDGSPPPVSTGRWSGQLLQRQDWLQAQGVGSLFAIAPNKHTIYPEFAPAWLPFGKDATRERLVAAALAGGVQIVDTAPVIGAGKCCRDVLYNRTDSHWTAPAAFSGYAAVMQALAAQDPQLRALEESDVSFTLARGPATGLAKLLRINQLLPGDYDQWYEQRIHRRAPAQCFIKLDQDFRGSTDCVPVGDEPVVPTYFFARELRNTDALNARSLLLVQDSFGIAVSQYFNHSFQTVWHAHIAYLLNGERLRKFVREKRPDFVVFLVVERNLLRAMAYEFDGASHVVEAERE